MYDKAICMDWNIGAVWLNVKQWIEKHKLLFKSPRYTGGDFMFLYRFVRRRRHRPQIFVHAITFELLFWISLIFSTIAGPDL